MHKVALFLLALGLACAAAQVDPPEARDDKDVTRKREEPWFCHGRDCPAFETEREEPEYSLRCYERSTWAVSCTFDAYMPDGVLRATARVLNYVKKHDLWGATPLGHVVHLSLDNQRAWLGWNATVSEAEAAEQGASLPSDSANWAHRIVCAAYYLPDKYQAAANSSRKEVDRRPPRPGRKSGVKLVRAPRFEAYVSGFHGFPTPPRFIWESMRLVHNLRWHREPFDWTTAMFFVYDPPTATEGRWNEVLIPARRFHDLLLGEGEVLGAGHAAEQ